MRREPISPRCSNTSRFLALHVTTYAVVFQRDHGRVEGPLSKAGIGSRTGLSVVAIEDRESLITHLTAETVLPRNGKLLMLGSDDQRRRFAEAFERL